MSKLALLALFSFIFSALAGSGQVMSSPVATDVLQKYVCQSNNCATADLLSFKQLGNHSFFIKPSRSSDVKASLIPAESKPDEAPQKATSPEHEVPEPATLMLFGTGLLGVAFILRRKLFP